MTNTERVRAMRKRRAAFGLIRMDVYIHPDDVAAIKALVGKLNRLRQKGKA